MKCPQMFFASEESFINLFFALCYPSKIATSDAGCCSKPTWLLVGELVEVPIDGTGRILAHGAADLSVRFPRRYLRGRLECRVGPAALSPSVPSEIGKATRGYFRSIHSV